jgi:hypothetical protein
MYFLQWMNLLYTDCIWIVHIFVCVCVCVCVIVKLSHLSVLTSTDILHHIIAHAHSIVLNTLPCVCTMETVYCVTVNSKGLKQHLAIHDYET